jgi:hypothetical protein
MIPSLKILLKEATNSRLIDTILEELDEMVYDLVERTAQRHEKQTGTPFTEYDREYTRLLVTVDLIKSIEKYTLPTDELIEITTSGVRSGSVTIDAVIERDGVQYPLSTEVIYAGGYNIQRLHYRYITKTTLPKTGSTTETQKYTERLKKLSKLEKLNSELNQYQIRYQNNLDAIESAKSKSESDIWKEIRSAKEYREWPSWAEIVRRGADKNYDYSEDLYNQEREESLQSNLEFWKRRNISWKEEDNTELKKIIARLKMKIQAAL